MTLPRASDDAFSDAGPPEPLSTRERAAVARVLAGSLGLGFLWAGDAPSEEAVALVRDPGAPVAPSDRVLLGLAVSLCGVAVTMDPADLLLLEPDQLDLVGSLLTATGKGRDALREWVRQNLPTREAPEAE